MNNKMNKQDKKQISNSQKQTRLRCAPTVCFWLYLLFLLVCALLPFVACLPLSALLSPAYHLLLPVCCFCLLLLLWLVTCLLLLACCCCCLLCCLLVVCLPACCCLLYVTCLLAFARKQALRSFLLRKNSLVIPKYHNHKAKKSQEKTKKAGTKASCIGWGLGEYKKK